MTRPTVAASAFSLPAFRYYLAGTAISYVGTWMERIALGWLAWELTASTFWTGFVTIAGLAPSGLIAPIVAAYAERWDMRIATVVLNLMLAAISMAIYILLVADMASIEILAVLSVCLGLVTACNLPVRLVLVTMVVPRAYLPSAVSNVAIAFNVSRILGPMLAGFLIVQAGLSVTILLNAISYLPLVIAVALIPTRTRAASPDPPGRILSRVLEGARRALSSRIIVICLIIAGINGLTVRAIIENLPMIVGGLIDGTSTQLSLLAAVGGAGSIIGAWIIGWQRGDAQGILRFCLVSLPCATLLLVPIGLYPAIPVLGASVLLLGINATVTGIGTQTLIQLAIEDDFRARIVTWWSAMNFASLTLGGMAVSALGEWIPLGAALAGLGVIGALLTLLTMLTLHPLRMERPEDAGT